MLRKVTKVHVYMTNALACTMLTSQIFQLQFLVADYQYSTVTLNYNSRFDSSVMSPQLATCLLKDRTSHASSVVLMATPTNISHQTQCCCSMLLHNSDMQQQHGHILQLPSRLYRTSIITNYSTCRRFQTYSVHALASKLHFTLNTMLICYCQKYKYSMYNQWVSLMA